MTDRYTKTILTIIAVALVVMVLQTQFASRAAAQAGKLRSTVSGHTSLIKADPISVRTERWISRTQIGKSLGRRLAT